MKEEIIKIAKELLKYKTISNQTIEFDNIFKYIKSICSNLFIKEYEFRNKKCLVVSNTTCKKLDVIICTHIDIVESNNYEIVENENNLYGRGTIDMKGSVASSIYTMNHISTNKKIALFITSDEEIGGNCVYELLKIYKSKFAIVPDGGKNFELIIEEKGALQIKITSTGISAHSSQPFNGENAIVKLYGVYERLIKKYPMPKNNDNYVTTINLSKIEGGSSNNTVPDKANMILDIRHVSKDTTKDIINFIKETKNIEIEILLDGGIFKTDLKNKYVKKYIDSCEKILNHNIATNGCESTSDAIYFYENNIPCVIMNPIGDYPHNPKEFVNKESLETLSKLYLDFINNL